MLFCKCFSYFEIETKFKLGNAVVEMNFIDSTFSFYLAFTAGIR